MSASNFIQLGTAVVYAYAGVSLIKSPAELCERLSVPLDLLETRVGLAAPSTSDESSLAAVGLLLLSLAYFYAYSVYTLDEKFKRNSTPGRVLLALGGVYICKNTPHGNSLIALFAAFNLATGLALGLLIGFGDGNVVDLEAAEAERLRRVKGDAVKAKSH